MQELPESAPKFEYEDAVKYIDMLAKQAEQLQLRVQAQGGLKKVITKTVRASVNAILGKDFIEQAQESYQ